jgi:hypothetical protein
VLLPVAIPPVSPAIIKSISPDPIAKAVIPVQTGIQEFLQYIEKTGFPLSWE